MWSDVRSEGEGPDSSKRGAWHLVWRPDIDCYYLAISLSVR